MTLEGRLIIAALLGILLPIVAITHQRRPAIWFVIGIAAPFADLSFQVVDEVVASVGIADASVFDDSSFFGPSGRAIFSILFAGACAAIAQQRDQSIGRWALAGMVSGAVLSWIGILLPIVQVLLRRASPKL